MTTPSSAMPESRSSDNFQQVDDTQSTGSKTQDNVTHTLNTSELNYATMALEHAELIKQGKTSLEIAGWLGNKLDIASWKAGAFHGERKVLSTPGQEEIKRFQKFTEQLGLTWSRDNRGSKSQPGFFLIDGYIQNKVFGEKNMKKADEKLNEFRNDWIAMQDNSVTPNYSPKEQYLKNKIGLAIEGDWSKLTGFYINGVFHSADKLLAYGSLVKKNCIHGFCFDKYGVSWSAGSPAQCASLCFLA